MKKMPYHLKQKLRQYNNAIKKADSLQNEIALEFEKYGVPYENLVAMNEMYNEHPSTEALAFINNNEGEIEDNIAEIEKVFLHFAKNNKK